MHESSYLLVIHTDAHMKKPHVYTTHALVVSAESVGFQDQLKVIAVFGVSLGSPVAIAEPIVVSGSGYTGNGAKILDREDVVRVLKSYGDSFVGCYGVPSSSRGNCRIFFTNASSCCVLRSSLWRSLMAASARFLLRSS